MNFTPRLTRPSAGNKYYITKAAGGYSAAIQGSPADTGCNVLANCVGYAYGRFNEIVGEGCCRYLRPVNAENFIQYAEGLDVGQEPRLGACMVWQKGATLAGTDGAGHVAIVEKIISATEIVTSESGWNAKKPFWTQTRKKGDGNWGQGSGYKFLGFIYNPAPCCKGVTPATPVATTEKGGTNVGFTNSSLATVKLISPNRTPNRNHPIDTITIHCFVGQVDAKRGCEVFQPSSKGASCNYVVGHDGSIGLCVEEKDRSWCTGGYKKVNGVNVPIRVNGISGSSNDYQAVTIEVASDTTHPYAITDKAMAALIELCADICRRNGIPKLLWSGDKTLVGKPAKQNMTVHRWFAAKACPGDYIYERLGDIAAKVNAKLGAAPAPAPTTPVSSVPYKVRITATDLRIRKGPGTDTAIVQSAIKPGVYTIVSEATGRGATKWGKLKSGLGWVSLDYCKKI